MVGVTRAGSGRWIVAAVALAAVAACVWVAVSFGVDDEAPARRDAASAAAIQEAATSRRPGRAASTAASSADESAAIEIDDEPMPQGATGRIRGVVRDDLGRPVADAWVAAFFWRADSDDRWPEYTDTRSSPDGSYAIEALEPSIVWELEAYTDDHARVRPASAIVFAAQRLEVAIDIVLPRNGSIEVVAVDAAGSPVAHTDRVLSVKDDDTEDRDKASLAPGRYRVLVEAPGRAGDSRVVDVAAGERTRVEFNLDEAVEISGVVVDDQRMPVRRVEVVAVVADGALAPFDGTAETAADGSFRIGGLRRTHYRLAVADPELSADVTEPLLAPATGVTLTLRDDARVTFRLVYPSGFPASDRSAEVGIEVSAKGAHRRPSPRWDGDQGTVRVPGGEQVDLVIFVPHCEPCSRSVRARPGEVLDIGEVRPNLERDVEGTVVDASGTPIAGAMVRFGVGRFSRVSATDRLGAFLIERMPQADCVLQVEAPGFVAARVECRADDTSRLVVKLVRGGLLWVRAAAASGAPLSAAAVRVDDPSGTAWWAAPSALDGHGECAVRLAPGRWRIAVAGCAPADVDVREGATTSVRVRSASDGR